MIDRRNPANANINGSITLEGSQNSTQNLYEMYYHYYGNMCNVEVIKLKNEEGKHIFTDYFDLKSINQYLIDTYPDAKVFTHEGNVLSKYFFFEDLMIRTWIENGYADSTGLSLNYGNVYPAELLEKIKTFKLKKEPNAKCIGVIVQTQNGLGITYIPLERYEFSEENYNDDLAENHEKIVKELNAKKSGIHLFYGIPGTGKTSYISTLTNLVSKNIIYVPNSIAPMMDSPQFLKLILDNTNSIFIIEDAEKIITSRELNTNSPIASLLNLSDGLIGQSAKCQIVCTFNTKLDNVDVALLRKGRLLSSYEFKALEEEKATKLAEKLGKEYKKGETTLGDIYNADIIKNAEVINKRSTIGFKIC